MAKSKHQKLAKLMQWMLDDIDAYIRKVAKQLNSLQFHFYEKCLVVGRPLMSKTTLKKMMQSHYVGLQHFSPNPGLQKALRIASWFGSVITKPIFSKRDLMPRKMIGYFIPWGVRIICPEGNKAKLERYVVKGLSSIVPLPTRYQQRSIGSRKKISQTH